ncbi:MAG: TIGR02588 family protein [Chloroflexota bacterium]|nr:TIGR02588 family protein [Chloroflexota bacterium]
MADQKPKEPAPKPEESTDAPDALAENALVSGDTPLLEWLVAAIGLLLVASTLGFIVYQALQENSVPPEMTVAVETVVAQRSGYLVTFRALNAGETTAAAVTVEGELRQGDQSIELSTATLDYVPAHSGRNGGLFFTHDPQQFELKLRAIGYAEP